MDSFEIQTASKTYPIFIGIQVAKKLPPFLQEKFPGRKKLFLITDSHVAALHADSLTRLLNQSGYDTLVHIVPSGEAAKSLSCYEECMTKGFRHHIGREGIILALGGGVIGDLAGFVAATYMIATAMTGGKVCLKEVVPSHLGPIIQPLRESGCFVFIKGRNVTLSSQKQLKRIKMIRTMPHPGFPTDVQAQMMALTTIADGTSVFIENIFESRYKHIGELLRFGAKIHAEGRMAVVEGVKTLNGANVKATDLRGGSAMILAGLSANGITEISHIHHIDRGYEKPEKVLEYLGADIKRVKENEEYTT